MKSKYLQYILLLLLSVIWGSAFILIKLCLEILSIQEIATLRILIPSILFFPIYLRYLKILNRQQIFVAFIVGLCNNLIPYFLYAFAETEINSYLAGFITSLTPLFTFIIGMLFFNTVLIKNRIFGICLSTIGSFLLLHVIGLSFLNIYTFSIVGATILYAIATNLIKSYFKDINPIIATAHIFIYTALPSLVLYFYYYQSSILQIDLYWPIYILGFFVTGLAAIIFIKLTQVSGPTFSSSVLYLVPIVGLGFGLLTGEQIQINHIIGILLTLFGVYFISKPS